MPMVRQRARLVQAAEGRGHEGLVLWQRMEETEMRPCDWCVWYTEYGCTMKDCEPLTRSDVKQMIAPLQTVRVDGLKPCPFCGSEDVEIGWFGKDGEAAICLGCGSAGPQYTNREKVIAAWNRRVDDG